MVHYSVYTDAIKQPHLLIAGTTGSGKSTLLDALLYTIVSSRPGFGPGEKTVILVDPKLVGFSKWKGTPHCLFHASFDKNGGVKEFVQAFDLALKIMGERLKEMVKQGVEKYHGGDVYLVIDEWASLYSLDKKAFLPRLIRLASQGRAAKVHIILSTQYPNAKMLPTEVKCNFASGFGLKTQTATQSRVIMNTTGCESLPALYGYGFYYKPGECTMYALPRYTESELNELTTLLMERKLHNEKRRTRCFSFQGFCRFAAGLAAIVGLWLAIQM